MKRLVIAVSAVALMFGFCAVTEGAENPTPVEPVAIVEAQPEPEKNVVASAPVEDMLVLTTVAGVPDTLTVTLSIGDTDIAVVQSDSILYSEPFPETQKADLNLRIEGQGRLIGAKFDFTQYIDVPMVPETGPQPAEEPLPAPGPTDETNVDPNNHPAGEQGMDPPIVDGDDNPAEPEPIIGDDAAENGTDSEGPNPAEDAAESETITDPTDGVVPDVPTDDATGDTKDAEDIADTTEGTEDIIDAAEDTNNQ